MCTSGPGCSGNCPQDEVIRRNGEDWKPIYDRCALCSCKDGQTFCRRRPCDCSDPDEDLFCCPSCDNRPTSQCLDQSGRTLYRSGASWLYGCQQCRCMEGEVDCWPLVCPVLLCEYTAVAEGECCPRCVTDPCLADNLSYDIRQACTDPTGVTRLSGDTWHMPQSPCTTCKCKNGKVCCSVDLDCLQNN
ncbi:Protein kinase C-binding protein nell1 [Ameca splendens]|uniref:Protein kinase C-binding protein nell1 n=1 Tax=Ameca splendens TaxID=208324 RepID=A0ABV1A072_9TELE